MGKLSQNYQFPIIERTSTSAVFSQLRRLWVATAKKVGNNTFLVTEQELLALTHNTSALNGHHTLKNEKFSLLVTPDFNALLLGVINPAESCYQTSISFDSENISDYINRLRNLYRNNSRIVDLIESQIAEKIPSQVNYVGDFVESILDLLGTNKDLNLTHPLHSIKDCSPRFSPPMGMSLNYQAEQQKILEQFKSHISNNWKLFDTIQIALERVRKLLEIDRLVIYQLNVATDTTEALPNTIDRVTYEALATESVASVLNFHARLL